MEKAEVRRRLITLQTELRRVCDRDPEQELLNPALSTTESLMEEAVHHLSSDDPLVAEATGLMTIENANDAAPLRIVDIVPVLGQLIAALDPPPPKRAEPMVWSPDIDKVRRRRF